LSNALGGAAQLSLGAGDDPLVMRVGEEEHRLGKSLHQGCSMNLKKIVAVVLTFVVVGFTVLGWAQVWPTPNHEPSRV
jgi:hypothetical protein